MRRTQLGKKPRMSSVPAGRLRWAWRAWVRKHPSKECFVESDMTFEAAHSCWATRGHTSAYRDAERLGRPATESGKHGTTVSSVEDACSRVPSRRRHAFRGPRGDPRRSVVPVQSAVDGLTSMVGFVNLSFFLGPQKSTVQLIEFLCVRRFRLPARPGVDC